MAVVDCGESWLVLIKTTCCQVSLAVGVVGYGDVLCGCVQGYGDVLCGCVQGYGGVLCAGL